MRHHYGPTPVDPLPIRDEWFHSRFRKAWLAAWRQTFGVTEPEFLKREALAVLSVASDRYTGAWERVAVTSSRPFPTPLAVQALREAYALSLQAHKRDGPEFDVMLMLARAYMTPTPREKR